MHVSTSTPTNRIQSIDFLRGLVMILMALDHVRMYFGYGTWYVEPTNLATTTPALFLTRWITHFCAPVFVFLAGTSACLFSMRIASIKETAWFLFTRGIWLICVELVVVNFAWTFDITYSFIILQVIWAIGISMLVLSALVFLPDTVILTVGILLIFGHNLLDPLTAQGSSVLDIIWYVLHQPQSVTLDSNRWINVSYPVLPWIGLMALGYAFGGLYRKEYPAERRKRWLLTIGFGATVLFIMVRAFNVYGEPRDWQVQDTVLFSLLSFLNTTKYPPSLHFLLMTTGPALIFLALAERVKHPVAKPIIVFGRVPFFFYILHLYVIHALAMILLMYTGHNGNEYILSAEAIRSGRLSDFGLNLEAVYLIWTLLIILLYPICQWYQTYRESHPFQGWLRYL